MGSSPTPPMMNSAFGELGIDASYAPLSVSKERFKEEFAKLRERRASGLNVAMPFKSEIIALLDHIGEVPSRIGAVNTVRREGERYVGFNTDVEGILAPLTARGSPPPRDALLIGAGGAARAFCEAMARFSCRKIKVVARDPSRALQFVNDMRVGLPSMEFEAAAFGRIGDRGFDLLFNASPIGSGGRRLPESLGRVVGKCAIIFDAVYRPVETELVRLAKTRGAKVIHGYEMLLHGDAAAFEILTGSRAPVRVMERTLLRTLSGDAG